MSDQSLRIVHCFRSPVGGIFRHVRDLVEAQSEAGHQVGILCDSSTGSDYEDKLFENIKPQLDLGLTRIPMKRSITPGDLMTLWRAYKEIRQMQPDIIHSHSAKGGAYGRLIGTGLRLGKSSVSEPGFGKVARLYCPHGGSIHYDANSLKGKVFFALERFLERFTDRLIFVSQYEADGYSDKVGKPRCATSLVYNGLGEDEFIPVTTAADARDFLYIGMMRDLKGPDVFIDAIAKLRDSDHPNITAHLVGDGPDKDRYIEQIHRLGLENNIEVHAAMPARKAFEMAEFVVVPSRAESMPYIVLEAIAAQKPILATNVGGIPEIFDGEEILLASAGSVEDLARRMSVMFQSDQLALAKVRASKLQARFSVGVMADAIETAYRSSLG